MTDGEDALTYLQAAAGEAAKKFNADGQLEAARMAHVIETILATAAGKLGKEATMRQQDEYDGPTGCPNCSCSD